MMMMRHDSLQQLARELQVMRLAIHDSTSAEQNDTIMKQGGHRLRIVRLPHFVRCGDAILTTRMLQGERERARAREKGDDEHKITVLRKINFQRYTSFWCLV